MFIKLLLLVVLFGLLFCQCALIYYIGGYNPNNSLTGLLNDFGVVLPSHLNRVVIMCGSPMIWLLPNVQLIIGSLFIIKQKYGLFVMTILSVLMMIAILYWVMYYPNILVALNS